MNREFKINITLDKKDFNKKQEEKALRVSKQICKVLNSLSFRAAFIKELNTFKYKNAERSAWKDASPIEIVEHFFSGMETLQPEKDYEMDLRFNLYSSFKSVVGYTYANVIDIWANTKYFNDNSLRGDMKSGSNIVHEYGHKLGFGHDFRATKARPDSVCYILNRAYNEAFTQVYGIKTKKVQVCYRSWKTLFRKKCYLKEEFISE